ncbi:MAG: site-specific DNA-methyltransferase [Phycisphaerales bacterium]|nr:MAG: site-specific DNA-methyltransferase [Phycisphaerales bacterium]
MTESSQSAAAAIPLDRVICADCLELLASWSGEAVDLAYLDPPFCTGQKQAADEGEYDDQWESAEAYLQFMRPRLEQVQRVLKPNGSILLHCDWRTSHRLRLMLDELFGPDRFVNHLIWAYGLGGSSPRRFARKHDDILFYAKGDDYYFEPPMVPSTSNRMKGQLKKATDVIDIPSINNMASERVGWPTQKPLALLELLIGACCPEGGLVLDPFCGSGTTLKAAANLGRHYIGIDISSDAIEIARRRLGVADSTPS